MTELPALDSLPLLFRAANLIQDAFLITTADLDLPGPQIVYVNRAFTEMTGYSAEEVVGHSPRFLQGELTPRDVLLRLRVCLRHGVDFDGRLINYRKDGSQFLLDLRIRPIRNHDGEVTHFFAVQRDVSKETEQQTHLESLEQAVHQTLDSILMFGSDGRVHFANPSYLEWSGMSTRDVLGKRVWTLPGFPRTREDFSWARRQLAQGLSWQREYEADIGPGNRRNLFTSISPVRRSDDAMGEFVAICRDVTERNRIETIADAHRAADQLGQIFAVIRHELGNPVNSVKSALTVLASEADPLSPRQSEYVSRILAEVARLEFLLVSLRSFGLFDRLRLEPIDVGRLMARVELLMTSEMQQRGIRLQVVPPPEGTVVSADEQGLLHVLVQLLKNSIDAVSASADPEIRVISEVAKRRLRLSVRDNGIGIPKDDLERAISPFFTTKKRAAGLGLASVSKLLSKMRGIVEIDSAPGVGTTVSIELDLVKTL